MNRLAWILVPALCLACVACGPYWYRHPELFTVASSHLNYVQIYCQASENAPRQRCDLRDNGQVIFREGRSVSVGDDFNIEYKDRHFTDDRTTYFNMDLTLFNASLQALVDAGLFMEEEKPEDDTPVYPKILVKANINHHVIDKFTFHEPLVAEIRAQLFQYRMAGRRIE